MALFIGFFMWRLLPLMKHHRENGPKGTSSEWMTTLMLLGGVVLFVIVLMALLG